MKGASCAARTLKSGLLLFVCGGLWGATPMLSKLAAEVDVHPVGLSLLVNVMGAVSCLSFCWARGKFTWPNRDALHFYLCWAVLFSVLNQVLIYWLSSRLDASLVSILTILEGFAVFAGAGIFGLEKASWRRAIGMAVGLISIAYLVISNTHLGYSYDVYMVAAALLVPFSYAAETLYIAARKPVQVDPFLAVGFVMACSLPMLALLALTTNDFLHLTWPPSRIEGFAFTMMLTTLCANFFFFQLITLSGSVFAGQVSYTSALCGIGWSVFVLGEKIPWSTYVIFGLIILALMLMQPKQVAVATS